MTSAEKAAKLAEVHQRMTDAQKERDLSDIPLTDPYWNICSTARIDINYLLNVVTKELEVLEEIKEEETNTEKIPEIVPEKSLADKMKDLMAGGNQ